MLAGIVVSNAILLVDYTNTLRAARQDGAARGDRARRPPPPAADSDDLGLHRRSAWCRWRSASAKAPSCRRRWRASSSAACSTSTMITLVFVPAMYTLFEEGWRGLFKKGAAAARRSSALIVSTRSPGRSSPAPFRERLEHEAPLAESRMRHQQPGPRSSASPYRIRSRSSVRGAPAIWPLAAPLRARWRAARRAARAAERRSSPTTARVQEARLVAGTPDRRGVDQRETRRSVTNPAELRDGEGEVGVAIAEVAAERDGDRRSRTRPPMLFRSSACRRRRRALVDRERAVPIRSSRPGRRLVEQALVLEHLAEHRRFSMPLWRALRHRLDLRPPLRRRTAGWRARPRRRAPASASRLAGRGRRRPRRIRRNRRADVEQRVLQPGDVGLLAVDDVLVGVVDVVVADVRAPPLRGASAARARSR